MEILLKKRIIVSTYQSVSCSGVKALRQLENETQKILNDLSINAEGNDKVFVGRIRRDLSNTKRLKPLGCF